MMNVQRGSREEDLLKAYWGVLYSYTPGRQISRFGKADAIEAVCKAHDVTLYNIEMMCENAGIERNEIRL